MDATAREFLQNLVETPSPSGYEQRIQEQVRQYAESFAERISTDVHGNLIACVNPDASLRVMLAGHCDQIGMLITHMDENGFLYAQTNGGWDAQQLIGQRMTIWTEQGPVAAVIARKPIHLLNEQERKQVTQLEELWLDIGAKDRDDAASVVTIGDPVTLELGYREMRNDLANSPGMDDAVGVWVVMEALRRASQQALICGVYAVSTVQEEVGLRGSKTSTFGIEPHVGIAVDVTHATDCPTIDQRQRGTIKLGQGPVIFRGPNINPTLAQQLMDTATDRQVPIQLAACGRATPNDANSIQVTRTGVATGLIGIPNRYMHSAVEMVSLQDLDHAADLLAGLLEQLRGDESFTPA